MGTPAELRVHNKNTSVYLYRKSDGYPHYVVNDLVKMNRQHTFEDPVGLATALIASVHPVLAYLDLARDFEEGSAGESVSPGNHLCRPCYQLAPKSVRVDDDSVRLEYLYDVVLDSDMTWRLRVSKAGYSGPASDSFDDIEWAFNEPLEQAAEEFSEPPKHR